MNSKENTKVFVSYSHEDASLVIPIVNLLRTNRSFVFLDQDTIPPGKKWKFEIKEALSKSDLIVVFWCKHAKQSDQVLLEWRTAIDLNKEVLPLLLDKTPLPIEMKEFQWIDFRATVGSSHRLINLSPSTIKLINPLSWFTGHTISIIIIIATLIFWGAGIFYLIQIEPLIKARMVTSPDHTLNPTKIRLLSTLFNIIIISFLVGVFTLVRVSGSIFKNPIKTKKYFAKTIETEIFRRVRG